MESDTAGRSDAVRERLERALGNTYEIERELGGGGMSRVFLAHDARLDRRVVVKVLAPDLAAGVSAARFAREVRVAARLQHPHVLPLLSAGEVDGLPYYTAPFVEGETLRAQLARDRSVPIAEAVRLLRELADALAYAHGEGIVHRDLKPENVLLSRGHAVVADFGVAKAVSVATAGGASRLAPAMEAATSSVTGLGMAVGTPAYMAPEQVAADPAVDHRADLYALGLIGYELLVGRHPFAGRSPQAVLAAHLTELPTPIAEQRPDVPPALDALVTRLLAKRPEDRPPSAEWVVRQLDAAATPAGGAFVPGLHSAPRQRRSMLVAVAAFVVLMVAAAIGWWRYATPQSERPVLAVLPFENLGPPTDAYFADGLTEEVRSRLAGIGGLSVIGGTSTRQYKGTTKPARQIARELGATHLLTAKVRWERTPNGSGRIRVSPELEHAVGEGSIVWAQPVEGRYDDLFATQAQVAEQVAAALNVALLARERRVMAARPATNLAAYDAYLRGRAREADPNWMAAPKRRATIAEYQRAVALDPRFAAAHARLALNYLMERLFSPDTGWRARARDHATRAIAIDSTLVEARLARAVLVANDGDPEKAYQMLKALAEDAPSDAMVYFHVGWAQLLLGHPVWALPSFERAALLEPRWAMPAGQIAGCYDRLARYQEAIRVREREVALSSDFAFPRVYQASSYLLWRGDTAAAREELAHADQRQLVPTLARGLGGGVAGRAIWWHVMPRSVLAAKDSLTLAGFLRGGADAPELFHLMKARHFAFTGRADRSRAHAESLIALAEPLWRRESGAGVSTDFALWPHRLTLPLVLAEAYADAGRVADAAKAVDQYVEEAPRSPRATSIDYRADVLINAAYVDARIGRRDLAVGRLAEALRLPARTLISPALLRADPSWAPLHGHPGFERLVRGAEPH